jgi:hypothetical protein
VYRFATYTRAKLQWEMKDDGRLEISIEDKEYRYRIEAFRSKAGVLKAPVRGAMDRRISESIDATVKLTVWDREGEEIFRDSSSTAGLEIVGDTESLQLR